MELCSWNTAWMKAVSSGSTPAAVGRGPRRRSTPCSSSDVRWSAATKAPAGVHCTLSGSPPSRRGALLKVWKPNSLATCREGAGTRA